MSCPVGWTSQRVLLEGRHNLDVLQLNRSSLLRMVVTFWAAKGRYNFFRINSACTIARVLRPQLATCQPAPREPATGHPGEKAHRGQLERSTYQEDQSPPTRAQGLEARCSQRNILDPVEPLTWTRGNLTRDGPAVGLGTVVDRRSSRRGVRKYCDPAAAADV